MEESSDNEVDLSRLAEVKISSTTGDQSSERDSSSLAPMKHQGASSRFTQIVHHVPCEPLWGSTSDMVKARQQAPRYEDYVGAPCHYPDGRPKVGPGKFNWYDAHFNPGKKYTNFQRNEEMYEDLKEFTFLFLDDPEMAEKHKENPVTYQEATRAWLKRVGEEEPDPEPLVDPQDRFVLLEKFKKPVDGAIKLWIKKRTCVYFTNEFFANVEKWFPTCLVAKVFSEETMQLFKRTLKRRDDGSYEIFARMITLGHWGIILNYLNTKKLSYTLTTYPDTVDLAFSMDYLNIELCLGGTRIFEHLIPYFRVAEDEDRRRIRYYFQTLPRMFFYCDIIECIANTGICPKFGILPDIAEEIQSRLMIINRQGPNLQRDQLKSRHKRSKE